MVKCMMGLEATLQDFCDHINDHKLIAPGWEITKVQSQGMVDVCRVQGWEVPEVFSLTPLNSPAALIHWCCLTVMAGQLSKSTLDGFRKTYAKAIPQQAHALVARPQDPPADQNNEVAQLDDDVEVEYQPVVHVYDSHFHLDRTRRRLHLKDTASAKDIEEAIPPTVKEYLVKVSGGVAVYCDPKSYPSKGRDSGTGEGGVQGYRGCTP